MTITNFGAFVRIVNYNDPFNLAYDLRVEVQRERGVWVTAWETNTLSNDYAHTEARAKVAELAS
jgi:hypothetical protein